MDISQVRFFPLMRRLWSFDVEGMDFSIFDELLQGC